MKSTTVVKDPVCGMDVETATAAGHAEHKGQTYHFCSAGCKKKFEANPEQFVGKSAKTQKPKNAKAAAKAKVVQNPPYTTKHGMTSPKFGSAGSGGAENDPGPEAD